MPTGYTAPLYEGKDISFRDFALRCARGMGATIMMRDEPLDAPIPEKFEPSPYYRKALAEAKANKDALLRMGLPEIAAAANVAYEKACDEHAAYDAEKQVIRRRYEGMLAEVHAWRPPTSEHDSFKAFMIQQITESMRFDCSPSPLPSPDRDRYEPTAWFQKQIDRTNEDIARYEKSWAEEVARTDERNRWLADLFASLETA